MAKAISSSDVGSWTKEAPPTQNCITCKCVINPEDASYVCIRCGADCCSAQHLKDHEEAPQRCKADGDVYITKTKKVTR
jgi:DNA-directed RNA polymerase subunit RPC12/RpoP